MNIIDKKINDGGKREELPTGAVREPMTGKGRFDLISPEGERRLALWYELGANKYAPRNWEKGISCQRCIDSAKRHINNYLLGDTSEDHLAAAVWNLFAIMHYERFNKDMQDIPVRLQADDTNLINSPMEVLCINGRRPGEAEKCEPDQTLALAQSAGTERLNMSDLLKLESIRKRNGDIKAFPLWDNIIHTKTGKGNWGSVDIAIDNASVQNIINREVVGVLYIVGKEEWNREVEE